MSIPKKRFLSSPFVLFGFGLLMFLGFFELLLIYYILPVTPAENAVIYDDIIFILICGILPIGMIIFNINKCFSMIRIDEKGIHISLFKIFNKKSFFWNEIKELRVINRVSQWLFIGKVSMEGLNYYQLLKNKNIIQMTFSHNVYLAIRLYSNLCIKNFNEK